MTAMLPRKFLSSSWRSRHVLISRQIFPALQRNPDVAVFPDEIVEGAQVELISLLHARFGEKFCDLEFADLVAFTIRKRS
jgi:hypothetical protein